MIAEGLHTYYGKSHILHGVSLEAGEGQVTALLGRNGAGKTTTLRSLMGLTPPREGRSRSSAPTTTTGRRSGSPRSASAMCRKAGRFFPTSPSRKICWCRWSGRALGRSQVSIELFPRLEERKSNRGRQLSGGEQEMLSIGRALLLNPKLLILDEPSQGLAPLIVREVFRIVSKMRAEGISVLLVEQNVRMSLEVADHAYVLDDGHVVYSGPARELAADEARVQSLAGASVEEWTPHCSIGRRSASSVRIFRIEAVFGAHLGHDREVFAAGDQTHDGRGHPAADNIGFNNIGLWPL